MNKEEFKKFWINILENKLDIEDANNYIQFDYKGCDAYIPSNNVIIDIDNGVTKQKDRELQSQIEITLDKLDKIEDDDFYPKYIILNNSNFIYLYDLSYPMEEPEMIDILNLDNEINRLLFAIHDRVIYQHRLLASFEPSDYNEIIIRNTKENNVLSRLNGKKYYSIPYEDIKEILELTKNNNELFKDKEIDFPPVLDGVEHQIYISDGERETKISAFNLWFYLEEETEDFHTKNLLNYIEQINKILDKNNINAESILELEDEEE